MMGELGAKAPKKIENYKMNICHLEFNHILALVKNAWGLHGLKKLHIYEILFPIKCHLTYQQFIQNAFCRYIRLDLLLKRNFTRSQDGIPFN